MFFIEVRSSSFSVFSKPNMYMVRLVDVIDRIITEMRRNMESGKEVWTMNGSIGAVIVVIRMGI